ncbi:hypothetical protein HPB50_004493 [Hyalomma asiaticum]|uniref:Uncharacterized protein n=1 Tax=Hyalomma asiaticum TaxID=266040 RepID=A0ACB7RHU4_HYAAI|nr:hypothetical protein HPB50_004493 [Hyalomma asiaticum]
MSSSESQPSSAKLTPEKGSVTSAGTIKASEGHTATPSTTPAFTGSSSARGSSSSGSGAALIPASPGEDDSEGTGSPMTVYKSKLAQLTDPSQPTLKFVGLRPVPRPGLANDSSESRLSSSPRTITFVLGLIVVCCMVPYMFSVICSSKTARTKKADEHRMNETTASPTVLPPSPGNVGAECNVSSPCIGEAQCEDGVCSCEEPGFVVVSGVCVSANPRRGSDKRKGARGIGTRLPRRGIRNRTSSKSGGPSSKTEDLHSFTETMPQW